MADTSFPALVPPIRPLTVLARLRAWLDRPAPGHAEREAERQVLRETLERTPDAFHSDIDLHHWMSGRPGDF